VHFCLHDTCLQYLALNEGFTCLFVCLGCCLFCTFQAEGDDAVCSDVQETAHADIVMPRGLKADSGGNGEPSVLDNPSTRLSEPAKFECCHQTELRTDDSGDHGESMSRSLAGIGSASGERALHGDGLEHGLCGDDKTIAEDQQVLEDISTLPAALQRDSPDEPLCGQSSITQDHAVTEDVLTVPATLQQDQLGEDFCDGKKVEDHHTMVGDVSVIPAALEGTEPDGGLCNRVTGDDHGMVQDVSTSCADISSVVSHMEVDVDEVTSDSTVSTGQGLKKS